MNKVIINKDLSYNIKALLALVVFELATIFSLSAQIDAISGQMLATLAFAISLIGGFVFSYRTVAAEDANKGMTFLRFLPFSNNEIVLSKFIVNIILCSLNFLIVWGGVVLYAIVFNGLSSPSINLVVLLLAIQLANNFFYLSIGLLFTSTRAIWIPFPVLLISINVFFNWQSVTSALPGIGAMFSSAAFTSLVLLIVMLLIVFVTTQRFPKTSQRLQKS